MKSILTRLKRKILLEYMILIENTFFEVCKGLVRKSLNEIDFRNIKIKFLEAVYRKNY